MTIHRITLLALPLLLLSACSTFTSKGDVYAQRSEAQIAYEGQQDDRAETLLVGLTRSAPSDPDTWFTLGNLYARTGRPEQAVAAYQKALMLNSTDARVWHNLGVVRTREAWAAFIQSYALVKDNDPLAPKIESIIEAMEKIPLEGLDRKARTPALSPADVRQ
jgi:cytochrome c-type biogenesis protein CcmH/NrfG